ncbi:hypothetical protein [Nostoc sp. LPT]|uniref:hypothetical protein n=1 Tax=Nostoc sp. LPT TaxID=2815387 RepID=UPI001D7F524C|nr:hypothetical protein [Nostoc sp. LPT]MBN4002389.1 hypothetical protein [Nostoc sp. LPT]
MWFSLLLVLKLSLPLHGDRVMEVSLLLMRSQYVISLKAISGLNTKSSTLQWY